VLYPIARGPRFAMDTTRKEHDRRRLAAILAAEVVGYSQLIEADEDGTLARLKAIRAELIDPKIAAHRGRLFKTTGDGFWWTRLATAYRRPQNNIPATVTA
jgi:class 3 adenylate cyclase